MKRHEFICVRQDVVRRTLRVASKEYVTPGMLRVIFHSEELGGFHSPSPDDHIKIFLPTPAGLSSIARDFTPCAWVEQAKTLTLDFAVHPHGPAIDWAWTALVGDSLEIGGPRGSTVAPSDFDWYLLIGDATALPSIGRRLEELPSHAIVRVIALVASRVEESYLASLPDRPITWLHATGNGERDAELALRAVERIQLPAGDGFIWISAEASVARLTYRYAVDVLRHPKEWIKAAGYWSAGKADGGERIA